MNLKMIDESSTASEVIIAALIALKDKIGGDPVVSLTLYEGDISVMMCADMSADSPFTTSVDAPVEAVISEIGGKADQLIRDGVIQLLAERLGIKPDGDDMIRLHAVYDGNQEEHKS